MARENVLLTRILLPLRYPPHSMLFSNTIVPHLYLFLSSLYLSVSATPSKHLTNRRLLPRRLEESSRCFGSVRTVGPREHLHDDVGTPLQPPEYRIGVDSDRTGHDGCRLLSTARLSDDVRRQVEAVIDGRGQHDDRQLTLPRSPAGHRTVRGRSANRWQHLSDRYCRPPCYLESFQIAPRLLRKVTYRWLVLGHITESNH